MKFCSKCGNQIDENAIFCPHCGHRTNGDESAFKNYNPYFNNMPVIDTKESKLVALLSFLFVDVGFILWLFIRGTRPGKARSALKGLLARLCFSLPILGAALWVLWRGEQAKGDYAKVAGISAIVGVAAYAFMIVAMIATNGFAGIDLNGLLEGLNEGMAAFISLR